MLQSFKVAYETPSFDPSRCASGPESDSVHQLFAFFSSEEFFRFVERLAPRRFVGTPAQSSGQLRCFARGDYSLIADEEYMQHARDQKLAEKGLEEAAGPAPHKRRKAPVREGEGAPCSLEASLLCVFSQEWDDDWGGASHYVTLEEELARAHPQPNTLALSVRKRHEYSFVKLVRTAAEEPRYDFTFVFPCGEGD
jgi:hypothetical protein